MRTEGTTVDDRALAVVPAIVCQHPDDVAHVQVVGDYRLAVRFHDGTSGIVDMSRLITSAKAGVFSELIDPDVFAQAAITLGAVTWPGGIDLAPDAMYTALKNDGVWELE